MKILFVDNFAINFGIALLSAVLKRAGHEVSLATYPLSKWKGIDIYRAPEKYFSFPKIASEIIRSRPAIVAFSVFSPNYMFYKRMAEALRKQCQLPILVGGVLPTLVPELFMENTCCDYLFRGEAEPVIAGLVEKIENGNFQDVPNLAYRSDREGIIYNEMTSFLEDIDSVPFYDKNLYPNIFKSLYILTSRGCPMTCTYCSAGKLSRKIIRPRSPIVRKRSVDCVIQEIKEALQEKPYERIFFYDDIFVGTLPWMEEFSDKYRREIGLPYFCTAVPAIINNENAALLAKSNCINVQIGFQTANDEYKRNVLSRMETKQQVANAIQHLRRHNIGFNLDHIFNLPGETREHIEESLDFYIEHKVHSLSIYFLNYFPDAPITQYAHKTGILNDADYARVMKNELVGEQSYKGTITDEKKSKEQVQFAILFRLLNFLPSRWVKFIFRYKGYKCFPTHRYFYYLISVLVEIKGRGLHFLLIILQLFFSPKNRPRKVE